MRARTEIMKKLSIITCMLFTPALVLGQGGLEPADMLKPLAEQWTTYSGDLTGKRFSSLKLVNTNTVKNLSLKWMSMGITTGCGPTGNPPAGEGGGGGRGGGRFGAPGPAAPIIV